MPSVQLNGVDYVLDPAKRGGRLSDTLAERIEPYSPQQRLESISALSGLTSPDNRVFPSFIRGFGRDRIESDKASDPKEYTYFYDSRCMTHWGDLRLPLLTTGTTELTNGEVLRAFVDFNNNVYSLWDFDSGASNKEVYISDFDGASTTWGNGVSVYNGTTVESIGVDIIAFKDRLVALLVSDNDHLTRNSTDASTWNTPSTEVDPNLLNGTQTHNSNKAYGRLEQVAGEAVAALWDENNGTVLVFSSTNGTAWSGSAEITLPDSGVCGIATYPGTDGEEKLYVLTSKSLWEIDTAPATWTYQKLLSFPRFASSRMSQRLVAHQGKLWVALDMDSNGPVPIYTLDNGSGVRVWDTQMGLDVGDGVISDLYGPAHHMYSAGKLLFMSVGGSASSRNARILVHNGDGWHNFHRFTTEAYPIDAIAVSAEDDATSRLHFSIRQGTGGGGVTSVAQFAANPLANPRSGVSLTYGTGLHIDLPLIDGGMPTTPCGWLQVAVDAGGLGTATAQEYIDVSHGLEGAARTTTDLGDVDSSTATLSYASGAGESGVSDALRLTLNRRSGDTSLTPAVRSIRMDYDKRPPNRNRFTFTVDLDATAEAGGKPGQGPQTVEGVRTALETARDLATLPTLVYGSTGPLYVRVESLRFYEEMRSAARPAVASVADRSKATRFRHGLVEVVCEEKV